MAPGLAHTLAAGLSRDTTDGTSAAAASAAGWTRSDIGKTGTTNTSESVVFVGGVGGLTGYAAASAVFADGPHPREICPGSPVHLGDCGHGAFGGTVAAPPYFATLTKLLGDTPTAAMPGPDPAYLQPGPRPVAVHGRHPGRGGDGDIAAGRLPTGHPDRPLDPARRPGREPDPAGKRGPG